MNVLTRVNNAFRALTANSITEGQIAARRFRNRGSMMNSDWSFTVMDEADKYTGFMYAAINNRAKKVAMLGKKHLFTTASKDITEKAKSSNEPIVHPYLDLIDTSTDFSNYRFWYYISTMLDLKGRFYLMAVRNKQGKLTGTVQSFKLLNPYNVRRVINQNTKELEGYVEGRDGLVRNIPTHMIIEIDMINPFGDEPFSMSDAAKDPQFTIKTAGDHTRHSIAKNRSTSGIVTINDDELALDPEKIKNFKSRITDKEKGEPIFGIGKGSITYNDMQIDLNKAALADVNDVNLKELIAVSGNSKTVFGIEESGVTRDTSETSKSSFISDHAVPQMQIIIDELNQDYKRYYPNEYIKDKYAIEVHDPAEDNLDAEIKGHSLRDKQLQTYQTMRDSGYNHETAAKYAQGEMELTELGEPTEEPKVTTLPDEPADNHIHAVHNLFEESEQGILAANQSALENAVRNIEKEVTAAVLNKVTKNQYETKDDIIAKQERERLQKELDSALQAFYLVVVPLFAKRMINRRKQEFGYDAVFSTNASVKSYVKTIAGKASASHMDTILEDLFRAIRETSLDGATQQELINVITSKYTEITKNRAKAIARTETNRAFTQSQYQADKQFLAQNKLLNRAYKKWITTTDNPCVLCSEMASRPPVLFKDDFLEFGDTLTVSYMDGEKTKVVSQRIDYEPLEAGNLHVNCGCKYMLIVE